MHCFSRLQSCFRHIVSEVDVEYFFSGIFSTKVGRTLGATKVQGSDEGNHFCSSMLFRSADADDADSVHSVGP